MEYENETETKIVSRDNTNNVNKNNNRNKQSNNSELTQEQFEIMKKIRDETLSRTERYSELIKDPDSNEAIFKIVDNDKKMKKIKSSENSLQTTNSIGIIDESKKEDINPNKERIYNSSHPFLFINGEPLIIIGPDAQYYVWIFSFVSLFSIIIYSLKNSNILFKLLFLFGYLFFALAYTSLLLINPGFPKNKNKVDPLMLQTHYIQCKDCNSISLRQNGKITIHCEKCKICIEHFEHHWNFATKCIGRGNRGIFKIWLYSIGTFFLIIFLYLIL